MNLKRIGSAFCALVMAVALAVPAFAADATPGQVAEDMASQVYKNPTLENGEALAAQINSDKNIVVSMAMADAMSRAIYANNASFANATINESSVSVIYKDPGASLTVSDLKVSGNTISISAAFEGGAQSSLGAVVSLYLKERLDPAQNYMWECNGQTGYVNFVVNDSPNAMYKTTVTFYAPHFSTYTIAPVGTTVTPEPPVVEEPSVTPPASNETVLKGTGADFNLALAGVVALCAVLVAGSAVLLKKRSHQ
ncbi:hypothetical protein [uncultured Ruthenibacterium sp.]|uniref:hypothetical protein n=1 Tax=uncultured Ruthenibacterium sp. TaxID=1905347 RepID=UPI00349E7C12